MADKNTSLPRDLSVGHDATIGRQLDVKGSVSVGHSVKIDGWLDAPNIIGTDKGLFETEDALISAYPSPQEGWTAYVGTSFPAKLYIVKDGVWTDTDSTGGEPSVKSEYLEEAVEQMQKDITTYNDNEEARVTAEADRVANEEARVTAETARATAETSREETETARTTAEAARVKAEEARVEAETARESGYSTIVEKATAATEAANEAAESASKCDVELSADNTLTTTNNKGESTSVALADAAGVATQLSDIENSIGGVSHEITNVDNYAIDIFGRWNKKTSAKMYIAKVTTDDVVTVKGTTSQTYVTIAYTTTDLTDMTVAEVVALGLKPTYIVRGSEQNDDAVNTWTATEDCWVICVNGISQPAATITSANKFTALQEQADAATEDIATLQELHEYDAADIRNIINNGTLLGTHNANTNLRLDSKTYSVLYFRVVLNGADSVAITMNENAQINHKVTATEDGYYRLACERYKVFSYALSFSGTIGTHTRVEVYSDNYPQSVNKAVSVANTVERYLFRKQTILGSAYITNSDSSAFSKYTAIRLKCTALKDGCAYTIKIGDNIIVSGGTDVDKEYTYICAGTEKVINIAYVFGTSPQDDCVFELEIGDPVYDIVDEHTTQIDNMQNDLSNGTEFSVLNRGNMYELLDKVYASYKTTQNTEATLKRISKTAKTYAHVSMFEIYDDTVYMAYMTNANYSSGESQTSTDYELVLDYFTLDRWGSDDFDAETDVTTVSLGKIGTEYTDADTGETLTAVRAPGDHSITIVDGVIHIVHAIRLESSSEATIISRQFDCSTKAFVDDSTHICKLVYGDDTYDFTTTNYRSIMTRLGYLITSDGTMHVSSNFVKIGTTYYNTIAGAGENVGAVIKTTDFITFTIAAIPDFNIHGADELMLGANGTNLIVVGRQKYGISHLAIGYYETNKSTWLTKTFMPSFNTRPYLFTYRGAVYMLAASSFDRDKWDLYKLTESSWKLWWGQVCTLNKIWDYPCVYVYNNTMYFSASLNSRRQISFGKLMLTTGSNVLKKFMQLIDG